MSKWNSSNKKCATCDYWSGCREIVNFGNYVEVDNSEKGSCNANGSTQRINEAKVAVWVCSDWEKWGALK